MFDGVLSGVRFGRAAVVARGVGVLVATFVCAQAFAQSVMSVTSSVSRPEPGATFVVTTRLDRPSPACGVVVQDGHGREIRQVIRGQEADLSLSFATDGRYQISAEGKPMFEGFDLVMACKGRAEATVVVESARNRAKRLAAEAAAKKAADERAAAEAARIAAEEQARQEAERAAAEADIAKQKADLEAAARQRAVERAKRIEEARAELAAARAEAKRQAEMSPLNRIRNLFKSSSDEAPSPSAAGASKMSCKLSEEKAVDDREKQCLYTCDDGSIEGRTRKRDVDCPKFINSANS